VVYVRNPLAHAVSELSTRIKSGIYMNSIELPQAGCGWGNRPTSAPHWNHRRLLTRWESIFPGQITVRLFQRRDWPERSFLRDFCESIDLPWRSDFRLPEPQNASLSMPVLRVINHINRALPRFHADGSLCPTRLAITKELADQDQRQIMYQPSEAEHTNYQSFFAPNDEWLRSSYFADHDELWDGIPAARNSTREEDFTTTLTSAEETLASTILRSIPCSRQAECSFRSRHGLQPSLDTSTLIPSSEIHQLFGSE